MICHASVQDWAAAYDGPPFHALLCDPPYELAFMGRQWDASGVSFRPETWAALGAHLLPGAFLMAFGGARTYHRLACAIEDAGFTIHSALGWIAGSGFPKATRIDTQVDKAAGAEREVIGTYQWPDGKPRNTATHQTKRNGIYRDIKTDDQPNDRSIKQPATPLAAAWAGHRYGLQALKPAIEFICLAQKPYVGKPVECITTTGAGALWIDGGRVGTEAITAHGGGINTNGRTYGGGLGIPAIDAGSNPHNGRWPANIALDEEAARRLDAQAGEHKSRGFYSNSLEKEPTPKQLFGSQLGVNSRDNTYAGQSGGPSRFFAQADWAYEVAEQLAAAEPVLYQAKASGSERENGLLGRVPCLKCGGLDTLTHKERRLRAESGVERLNRRNAEQGYRPDSYTHGDEYEEVDVPCRRSNHPTVKPIALARWLATLLLPPAQYAPRRLLVPFCGVGSEMIGAMLAGWDDVQGIEKEAEYVAIAEKRLPYWIGQGQQLALGAS